MEVLLEVVSGVGLVAAIACALGSLVIGVRAWSRRMDEHMGSWLKAATLPVRSAAQRAPRRRSEPERARPRARAR
jgi:hypothetical protein